MGISAAAMFSTVGASTAASAVADTAFTSFLAGTGTAAAADSVATAALTGSFAGGALATGMGYLSTAAKVLNVGSTIVQGFGSLESGKAGQQEADFEAKQLKQKQNEEMAAGENQMLVENRNTALAMSKVQNNAAAGGGALDPSVVNILGDLETQGRMNAANTLYNASSKATDLSNEALMARFKGSQENEAGQIGAVTDFMKAGTQSMYDKYNGGYG